MEAKIITMATMESQNEFTKIFNYGNIKLFISKAYDDVDDKHFITAAIPEIPECNVAHVQFPIPFGSENERNSNFDTFDVNVATHFIEGVITQIKENNQKVQ